MSARSNGERRVDAPSKQETEERFRVAIESSPLVVANQDLDLRYTWIGNPPPGLGAAVGRTDEQLFPPLEAARLNELKRSVLTSGRGARQELSLTVGGAQRFYALTVEPLRGPDGRLHGITVAAFDMTERRAIEAELRSSQARLAEAQQIARLGSFEWDLASGRMVWSEEMYRLYGVTRSTFEPSHETWIALVHPQDRATIAACVQRIVAGEGYQEVTIRIVRPDGVERFVHGRGRPVRDVAGQTIAVVGTHQDVTQIHEAVQAIATSREDLAAAQAIAHVGSWEWDVATGCVTGSAELARILGGEPRSLDDALRRVHPEDRAAVQAALERLVRDGTVELACRLVHPDGGTRFVHGRGRSDAVPGRRAARARGTVQDVTAFRSAERRFRELFDGMPIGLVQARLDGTVVAVNAAMAAIFGMDDPAELVGRNAAELYADPSKRAEFVARLARERVIRGTEIRFRRKDGSEFWGRANVRLFRTEAGEEQVEGAVEDVTEVVRARDATTEASLLKSTFLANISHEIRTPLNVMLGYAEILADGEARGGGSESERHAIESMRRAGSRLLETVNKILDMSRLEAGAFEVRPVDLPLHEVVASEVRSFLEDAAAKGLALECRLPPEPLRVRFDEYSLRRALRNLLENAIKFTPSGTVAVRARRTGDAVRVDVVDTGVGIGPEYVSRLFQPFTQEDVGYTRRFEGAGLGLALARRYVERSGGTIEMRSRKGAGSVFTLVLPAAGAAATPRS